MHEVCVWNHEFFWFALNATDGDLLAIVTHYKPSTGIQTNSNIYYGVGTSQIEDGRRNESNIADKSEGRVCSMLHKTCAVLPKISNRYITAVTVTRFSIITTQNKHVKFTCSDMQAMKTLALFRPAIMSAYNPEF